MNWFRHHGRQVAGTFLAAFLVPAGTASADVTPAQVWEAVSAQMKSQGYDFTVKTLSDTPDSLVLGDVTYAIELPDGGKVQVVTRGMRFDADGSGGVTGDFSHLTMAMSGAGQVVHFTGTPDKIDSSYDWTLTTLSLTSLSLDGKPVDTTATMTMHDTVGHVSFTAAPDGGAPITDGDIKIAGMDIDAGGTVDDTPPATWKATGGVKDIMVSGSNLTPGAMITGIPKSGSSDVAYGEGELNVSVDGDKGAVEIGLKQTSGFLKSAVEKGHLIYGTGSTGFDVSVSGSLVPVSGTVFKMASSQSHLDVPLTAGDAPQSFGLAVNFDGIELGDQVWAMFDPQATLSRDPAALSLDLSGDAILKKNVGDMMNDPQALEGMGSPVELSSLLLKGFVAKAFGAELTAQGNATFTPPSPLPVGTLDINAKNITTVLQQLSVLGLVDPTTSGVAQMMLGMYAVQGDAPDTWTSHIELTKDGGVLVNGQPMQ